MDRREYLAALGGVAGSLAGCVAPGTEGRDGSADVTPPRPSDGLAVPDDLPMPASALERGALRDAIPAIVDPAFGPDWTGVTVDVRDEFGEREATPRLADSDRVVGVERGGERRAYPLWVLAWHEVVNDALDGPLLVTYCPLCGSAIVAERRVQARPTVFGVSGLLWRSNLVLYDRETDSLWSQLAATAVRGPATGESLSVLPSALTTWGDWRARHPDTVVLRPPPESGSVVGREAAVRDYTLDPYGAYRTNDRIGLDGPIEDAGRHPKTQVLGVVVGDEARAYPLPVVRSAGVVNDGVGGLPVVVAVTPDGRLVGYDRRVGGTTLRFEPNGHDELRAGGSHWRRATGRAVAGPHAGTRLDRATDASALFWFAWRRFHPDTTVYGGRS